MTISKIFIVIVLIFIQSNVEAYHYSDAKVELTSKQARALQSLNEQSNVLNVKPPQKTIRVRITQLKDNQGQVYLGAIISRAELSPYLVKLEQLLGNSFQVFRKYQAARDHQLFHMTLLAPQEYQFADKTLVAKLLAPDFNSNFSSQLNVTLLGLGKVEQENKQTYYVVAQSNDAQLIRQRFLLKNKDFHVTLGFNPNDIYGVRKDSSTLISSY
jgi:hypothetical protein